jgi:hypothetical protein
MEKLLSAQQVADNLGIHPKTLYKSPPRRQDCVEIHSCEGAQHRFPASGCRGVFVGTGSQS